MSLRAEPLLNEPCWGPGEPCEKPSRERQGYLNAIIISLRKRETSPGLSKHRTPLGWRLSGGWARRGVGEVCAGRARGWERASAIPAPCGDAVSVAASCSVPRVDLGGLCLNPPRFGEPVASLAMGRNREVREQSSTRFGNEQRDQPSPVHAILI